MMEHERAINAAYRKLGKARAVGTMIFEREGAWWIQERNGSEPLAIRSTLGEAVEVALKRLKARNGGE